MAEIRDLLEYDLWATQLALESLKDLSVEEFTRATHGELSSIRQQSVHMVLVVDRYRARLSGEEVPDRSTESFATPADVIAFGEEVADRMRSFISRLGDFQMDQEVEQQTRRGLFIVTIEQVLIHTVNHSTYHRGQIAAMLKELGHEPVDTDFVIWVKYRSGN